MLRRFLPKSLYARIVLIVILPIFLMQSVITYIFFDRHWDLVTANLSANVAGQIALVTALYQEQADPAARKEIEEYSLNYLDLTIRYQPNEKIPEQDKLSILDFYNESLDRELADRLDKDFWINSVNWPAYVEVRVEMNGGYLVFLPRKERVYATTGPIFVMWLIGATLLIGWIAIVFMRNQVRSILRLASAAEAFGRGRDAPGFRPTGATEVRRAGRAFIAMRHRIKRHMQQRTDMLAGVSHDLKTILTRMKLSLALQKPGEETDALNADIDEMKQMLEAYLDFARDISGDEEIKEVDVGALVEELSADARRNNNALTVDVEDGVMLSAKRDALKRALANLIENGFKYAHAVSLTVFTEGVFVKFIVDDDGPGIAPEDVETAFKPFVRLDAARNQNIAGVGLGLSVVRDVARSHGGMVEMETSPKGGLRAILKTPA